MRIDSYGHVHSKAHLRHLPDEMTLRDYDDTGDQLAIVYPLYEGTPGGGIPSHYPKAAVYSAQSVIVNTDVVRRKVPIYFMVEDVVYDDWATQLSEWGIRAERVIPFTPPPAPRIKERRYGKSLYVLKTGLLEWYEHVVTWDADLFVCCDPLLDIELSTYFLQNNNLSTFNYNLDVAGWWSKENWWFKYGGDSAERVWENYMRTVEGIHTVYPDLELNSRTDLPMLEGAIMGFSCRMPKDFKEFALALEPVVGDDELIFALWMHKTGQRIKGLDLRPFLFDVNKDFLSVRESGVYWSHFWMAGKEMEPWEILWQSDIGIKV